MTGARATFAERARTAARHPLSRVLLLAFATRAIWILLCPNEPVSDQAIYHVSAKNILAGVGFAFENGDAIGFWPVGYSGALAGVYAVLGTSIGSAYVFNLVLGVVTSWLTYLLARELFDRRVALAAALLVTLYPSFIAYTTVIASENLYVPLWVASVLFMVRAQSGRTLSAWVFACGVVASFASLVRPTAFVFPLLVFSTGLLFRQRIGRCLAQTGVVIALILAVGLPWALRNREVFGEFSYAPFNGGVVMWIGNHAGADGQNITGDLTRWGAPSAEGLSAPAYDRALKQAAVAYIKHHPFDFVRLAVLRSYHTLKAETIAIVWNAAGIRKAFGEGALMPLKIVTTLGYALVVLTGVAGVASRALNRSIGRSDFVVLCAVFAASIPFLIVLGMDRYHLPLIPLVAILSATLVPRRVAATP